LHHQEKLSIESSRKAGVHIVAKRGKTMHLGRLAAGKATGGKAFDGAYAGPSPQQRLPDLGPGTPESTDDSRPRDHHTIIHD
jgi:hypothetical protein